MAYIVTHWRGSTAVNVVICKTEFESGGAVDKMWEIAQTKDIISVFSRALNKVTSQSIKP